MHGRQQHLHFHFSDTLVDHYDSEQSEAYMSDAAGRIVTPRATAMASVEEDDALQADLLAPVVRHRMPRVRGILSEDQREDELSLQQLEARRHRIGPGLERSGAVSYTHLTLPTKRIV